MLQAALFGALAQSALVLSGLAVYRITVPPRVLGSLAGFGGGALIAAIAFDLIPEGEVLTNPELALWLLAGALLFVTADRIVEARFGGDSSSSDDDATSEGGGASEGAGQPLGIVIGSVVDGVPESLIFGIQLAAGLAISPAFFMAVFVSNIPQALAPSAELKKAGWPWVRMLAMWGTVVVACGVTAGLGYFVADAVGAEGGRAAALGSGGILAMLTDSLLPYAIRRGGPMAGVWTVVGFATGLASS